MQLTNNRLYFKVINLGTAHNTSFTVKTTTFWKFILFLSTVSPLPLISKPRNYECLHILTILNMETELIYKMTLVCQLR